MRDKHTDYLDNQILDNLADALKIEEQWLASIGAPTKRLPKHVAEAVATRIVLSSMPVEFGRGLIERVISNRIIKQIREERR